MVSETVILAWMWNLHPNSYIAVCVSAETEKICILTSNFGLPQIAVGNWLDC